MICLGQQERFINENNLRKILYTRAEVKKNNHLTEHLILLIGQERMQGEIQRKNALNFQISKMSGYRTRFFRVLLQRGKGFSNSQGIWNNEQCGTYESVHY